MATTKTLTPTNQTITIDAFQGEKPDHRHVADAETKLADAINALNSQINTSVKQKDYYDLTTEADLKAALADMIDKTPSNGSAYFILRTLSASSELLGMGKGVYACISCRTSASAYGTILLFSYANGNLFKFRYNAGVSNESYLMKYEETPIARW